MIFTMIKPQIFLATSANRLENSGSAYHYAVPFLVCNSQQERAEGDLEQSAGYNVESFC